MKKKIGIAAGCAAGIFLLVLLLLFGTASPCGITKKMLAGRIVEAGASLKDNPFAGLFYTGAANAIDKLTETMTPIQCIKADWNMAFGDKGPTIPATTPAEAANNSPAANPPSTSASTTPAPDSNDWQVDTKTSPVDDSTTVSLLKTSNETDTGTFGQKEQAALFVTCQEGNIGAGVLSHQMVKTDYEDGERTSTLTIRWDAEKAYEKTFRVAPASEVMLSEASKDDIKKMLAHKKLLVRYELYDGTTQTFAFDLSELPEKIGPVEKSCHWTP
jgi:hypothetical protein